MIASMTAFGRTEETTEIGHIICEIRSVNHRYLEISLRLPEDLRVLEASIREHISNRIKRGKIECTLRYEPGENIAGGLSINDTLLNAILDTADSIADKIPETGPVNPMDVLRWPGVINREIPDPGIVSGPVLEQLDKTLDLVIETRWREGEKLGTMIRERCDMALEIVTNIKHKLPDIINGLRDRLLTRIRELKVELDYERLEQEVALLAYKFDVAEELDRLEAHINEVKRLLDDPSGPVGRRLDFLMQEMNREANTLGSKASHYDCSRASVELKALIEQMREQIQNIE